MSNASDGSKGSSDSRAPRGSFGRTFFIVFLLAVTALVVVIVWRFIMPALLAAITAALFHPLYRYLHARIRKDGMTALLAVVVVVAVFVVPLAAFGYLAADTVLMFAQNVRDGAGNVRTEIQGVVETIAALPIFRRFDIEPVQVVESIISGLGLADIGILSGVSSAVQTLGRTALHIFIYVYSLYFFFRDGPSLLAKIFDRIPMRQQDKDVLLDKFVTVTRATIKGTIIIGVFQGAIGGLVMFILGFPGAVVWGVLLFFLAAIPNFGAILVWLPAAVYLFASGAVVRGILMVALAGGLLAAVDYLLRPRLIQEDIRVHQLLVLFGVFGGLILFGVFGLILGPIVMAVFVKMWEIYSDLFHREIEVAEHGDGS
jgi:predicted PurR-regulated permease PerM